MVHETKAQYPLGTIFPTNGRPHLPTMCAHRTGKRMNHRPVTVLCYAEGEYELVKPDGSVMMVSTAYGDMPWTFCAKHVDAVVKSYALDGCGRCMKARKLS